MQICFCFYIGKYGSNRRSSRRVRVCRDGRELRCKTAPTKPGPATSLNDTEQIFQVLISAPLNSDEFEAALDRLFADDSATTAALTPQTPSPAGCTSGGLGAQDAKASARVTECFCAPSPTPPADTSIKVPTTSTTAHPVDQVRGRKDVTIVTIPESSTMLQDPSLGLCSAQTSGSSVTLISANAAASAIGDVEWSVSNPRLWPSGPRLSLNSNPSMKQPLLHRRPDRVYF